MGRTPQLLGMNIRSDTVPQYVADNTAATLDASFPSDTVCCMETTMICANGVNLWIQESDISFSFLEASLFPPPWWQ